MSIIGAAAALAAAQAVNIRGTVKDASGAGIAGATVRLEKAGYRTVTGADGAFTLTEASAGLSAPAGAARSPVSAVAFAAGRIRIGLSRRAPVTVSVHDLEGRSLAAATHALAAGEHAVEPPAGGGGLRLYRVEAAGSASWIRGVSLPGAGDAASVRAGGREGLAKGAAPAAGFDDVLAVGKEGLLDLRLAVTSPSASNLDIRMIPSAGVLKDADGNEYQTARFGNQVWTVEHFRSRKFADGTPIPHVTETSAWANRTQPAYCSYGNTTDPGEIRAYGYLYNWHTLSRIVPPGWRVPTEADWTALQNHLIANRFNYDNSTSGNKIAKAMASRLGWTASTAAGAVGNDPATNNRSGFNAMPTGFRLQTGGFTSKGSRSIMHSTAEKNDQWGSFGYFADLSATASGVRWSDDWKSMGFSLRLVRE